MTEYNVLTDPDGRQVSFKLDLPPLLARQAWNAQDPLASIHHYLVVMQIVIPAAFGVRMCLQCPHCNMDANNPNNNKSKSLASTSSVCGCSDLLGCNNKLIGGFAGIATAMIFANEFQGEGTPHGHGFVSLANIYQHNSLQDVAVMMESNVRNMSTNEVVQRVKAFCNHVQRESHFDLEQHESNLDKLEKGFHCGNDEAQDLSNIHLCVRPRELFQDRSSCSMWTNGDIEGVTNDARHFKSLYEADAQFIFSRCQHHWHVKNDKGVRVPLPYCRVKGRGVKKDLCCKQNFPRHVAGQDRRKARLVCRGVAAELKLKISGRRNMLGCIAPERNEQYFASTSPVLSISIRSKTNIQCPYRLPINKDTHDPQCNLKDCLDSITYQQLNRIAQRAMKQMCGYFGGYISKKQRVGQYECKKSIGA